LLPPKAEARIRGTWLVINSSSSRQGLEITLNLEHHHEGWARQNGTWYFDGLHFTIMVDFPLASYPSQ
jgi:hypothetical protein